MTVHVERLIGEVIGQHDRSTDKCLQRQCREHIQTETTVQISTGTMSCKIVAALQSCYVDHDIVRRKIVQHISLGIGPECKEAGKGHGEAHEQRNPGRVMCDHGKAIHGRFLERSVDKKAIMIYQRVSTMKRRDGCSATYGRRRLYISQSISKKFLLKSRFSWHLNAPNEITPTAWKNPEFIQSKPLTSPRVS